MRKSVAAARSLSIAILSAVGLTGPALAGGGPEHSIAREWNEQLLSAIRLDLARPTVHARNLFHASVVMWDAWAAYDDHADQFLHHERATASDVQAAREEAISYASYRLLRWRFQTSPHVVEVYASLDAEMAKLGYDINFTSTEGDTPAALGNRIAQHMIDWGLQDGANEDLGYINLFYQPVNEPLIVALPGNPSMTDPNRWQPLAISFFIDQNGIPIPGGYPPFLSAEWGQVIPFCLRDSQLTVYNRDGFDYWVYLDPGAPPLLNGVGDERYKWSAELVAVWSGQLDPTDGVMWDTSPGAFGNYSDIPNSTLAEEQAYYDILNGGDAGQGHPINPYTGKPYTPQIVPRGDFSRCLAEFWADGPNSETPPGHWFTILNYVTDHPLFERRFGGTGDIVDPLEWDVKSYLMMGGAMHDAAVAIWGIKGWYDWSRPISAIRYMADRGQCDDPEALSYNPEGIHLIPGHIELVTEETIQPGQRHEHLAGENNENVGKIALYAWRGPEYINDPDTEDAGAGWILAENWWPYQRPSFVTPPFAGYVSGHSGYSRAAAEVLTLLTGNEFFPGGLGEFHCPQNEFLVFEDGPSVDLTLQYGTYYDASNQSSLSRIWGGIHPPADDLPARRIGSIVGPQAYHEAIKYFDGRISCPANWNGDSQLTSQDFFDFTGDFFGGNADYNDDAVTTSQDFFDFIGDFLAGCD